MFLKLSKLSSMGVLEGRGGGRQQASCLVAKHAVEFPQVLTSGIHYPKVMLINKHKNHM